MWGLMKPVSLAFFLLVANVAQLNGTVLTYSFSGGFTFSPFGPIPTGTSLAGSFSIDTSALGTTGSPPNQAITTYLNSNSVTFSVPTVGLTAISSQGFVGSAQIQHSTLPVNPDYLVLDFPISTFSGVGWSAPSTPHSLAAEISFSFPQGTLTDFAHLPITIGLHSNGGAIVFGPGDYTYPGGIYHVGGSLNEAATTLVSLSIVPEPSTLALTVFGFVALAWRLRKRR